MQHPSLTIPWFQIYGAVALRRVFGRATVSVVENEHVVLTLPAPTDKAYSLYVRGSFVIST
jgi:hypothetical protein